MLRSWFLSKQSERNSWLERNFDQDSVIKLIKGLSSSDEGNKVLIAYEAKEASAEIELPNDYLIDLKDENINALKDAFGKDNINLVYHSRKHLN